MKFALHLSLLITTVLLSATTLSAQTTVTYTENPADILNPERGFYRYTATRASNYTPLTQSQLAGFRNISTPSGGNYSVASSLVFRYFFLDDFTADPISSNFLNAVETDFAIARAAGVKIIPRFAYTNEVDGSGCGSFICPPYGDAPKSIVLDHINQLAPILTANKDVIAVVQLGFIGTWGEGYYTDYFGDASPEGTGKWSGENWRDRNDVLAAMLQALPADRMVQIRYPQWKQRYLGGINVPTSFGALSEAEAYSGSDGSRIGFHNDCLLASAADFGTYFDYGNDNSNVQFDTTNLKPYFAADSRYVPVGGETCSDGYSPQNDCAATNGQAYGDAELRRMHYSYLNADYNNDVNNDWENGGCMDNIKRSLGYRFVLEQGTFPDQALAGGNLAIGLTLENTGYAAPFNPRGLELILRAGNSGEIWRVALDDDPRRWWPDASISINSTACLPAGMPSGQYEVLLHLPDPEPALYGRPEFSVRLANRLPGGNDVWEEGTGFNKLGHTVTINSGGGSCSSTTVFVADNVSLPVTYRYFTATSQAKSIDLFWSLTTAENLSQFIVERSLNGDNFVPVTSLDAAITRPHDYTFTDQEVQVNTSYFYRIRSVDFDGIVQYSTIVTSRLTGPDNSPILYPNPTTGDLQISWPAGEPEEGVIKVYNLLGTLQLQQNVSQHLSIRGLPEGIYTIVIEGQRLRHSSRVVLR